MKTCQWKKDNPDRSVIIDPKDIIYAYTAECGKGVFMKFSIERTDFIYCPYCGNKMALENDDNEEFYIKSEGRMVLPEVTE